MEKMRLVEELQNVLSSIRITNVVVCERDSIFVTCKKQVCIKGRASINTNEQALFLSYLGSRKDNLQHSIASPFICRELCQVKK